MGIYILPRANEGSAYDPGFMQNINPILGGLGNGMQKGIADYQTEQKRTKSFDDSARKAAEQGLQLSGITTDENGNPKLEYKNPAFEKRDGFKSEDLLAVLSGIRPPSAMGMNKNTVDPNIFAPKSVGQAEGGQVLTPLGSTVRDGVIYDSAGNRIGETTDESLPNVPDAITDSSIREVLNNKLRMGDAVTSRAAGITPTESPEYQADLSNAIKSVSEGKDAFAAYQMIAAKYPNKSEELKRILMKPSAPNLVDLNQLLSE